MKSKIEWCDRSDWNPLRGCTRVSPGCGGPGQHGGCYAEAIAARFSDPGQAFHGFAERTKSGPRWTGKVELIEERLTEPLRWRKPARIFALSMSDLFHESVPDAWIDRIFAVMALCPRHTFQVLTKRAARMRAYCSKRRTAMTLGFEYAWGGDAPLPNVWLGVSVEDQRRWDERIPDLAQTPSALRWVSLEPQLERVDAHFDMMMPQGPRWIVVGGESGPGARPFNIEWARSIIAQCKAAGAAVFIKQLGSKPHYGPGIPGSREFLRDRKGGDIAEFPPDLRIREFPSVLPSAGPWTEAE